MLDFSLASQLDRADRQGAQWPWQIEEWGHGSLLVETEWVRYVGRLSEWLRTRVMTKEFWQLNRVQKKAMFSEYAEVWDE